MEMKDFSPLMMQAFRGTEATIAQGFGGKADYSNLDFRMMIMSGADAPLRAAVLSSGGSFPAAAAQGLLAAANGQTDGRRDRTTFPFGQGTAGTVARAVKTAQTCPRKILYSAVWQQLCQHTCPEQRTEQKIDNKQKREPPVKCGSRFCP